MVRLEKKSKGSYNIILLESTSASSLKCSLAATFGILWWKHAVLTPNDIKLYISATKWTKVKVINIKKKIVIPFRI